MRSEAREAALHTVGAAFLRTRPLLAGPLIVATLVTLIVDGAPMSQRILAGGGFLGVGSFFVAEAIRHRRRPVSGVGLFASLAFTASAITFGCLVTGAIRSPLLPVLLAPIGVGFAAFGDDRRSRALLAIGAAAALLLALVPPPFAPMSSTGARVLGAFATIVAAALLRAGVARITDAFVATRGELRDTQEELVTAAVERTTMLEEVGARVAHEVNNPLAAVKGLVELVSEDVGDERSKQRLAVARGEIDRIEAILRDYLGFARPLGHYEPAPADIGDVARGVAALLEARADTAGVRLELSGPTLVCAIDVARMKEALLNLTLNALQATRPGGVVEIAWEPRGAHGFALTVADDGAGMDDDALAKVGTPFFTRRPGGVGLGVALAKRAIELHHGSLRYERRPHGGTKVTVTCSKAP